MSKPPRAQHPKNTADEVDTHVVRCADAIKQPERLTVEIEALRALDNPRAEFAAALFDLEFARRGDAGAKANLPHTADTLLTIWRDKQVGPLIDQNPTLRLLWDEASALLAQFEASLFAQALARCYSSRTDAAALAAQMESLGPKGNRRVEFALCLYHLELARLGVRESRVAFATRVELIREAYLSKDVASQLVGEDEGLSALWKDLVPYLDEFFDSAEEADVEEESPAATPPPPPPLDLTPRPFVPAEPIAKPLPSVPRAPPPSFSDLMPSVAADMALDKVDVDVVGVEELLPAGAHLPPPPPPPSLPPPAPQRTDESFDIVEGEFLGDGPSSECQAFWRHTEAELLLLPPLDMPRSSVRVLMAEERQDRKRLQGYLDGLGDRFKTVPEAATFQCLLRLYLAGHLKDKSLFGAPNEKKKTAVKAALEFLTAEPEAAGHGAVWFELDGAETSKRLWEGLTPMFGYLAFCARQQLDPTTMEARELYFKT